MGQDFIEAVLQSPWGMKYLADRDDDGEPVVDVTNSLTKLAEIAESWEKFNVLALFDVSWEQWENELEVVGPVPANFLHQAAVAYSTSRSVAGFPVWLVAVA